MKISKFGGGCLFLMLTLLLSALGQTNRGVGVRVKGSNGQTKEVTLYDGSYALVLGESNYTAGWDILEGVKTDVSEVKRVLERGSFTVEAELNLTSDALKARIDRFISDYGFGKNNRLLIYFAGHGHTQKSFDGRDLGYIIPTDTPLPDKDEIGFRRKAISMDTIQAYARQIEAKHAIFIFDSCFSGKLVSRERVVVPPIIEENTTYPVRQFITSGAANQSVPDDSVFRKVFVRGLEGEGDLNNDGYITGTELAEFLKNKVTNATERRQTPQYGKISDIDLERGDFVFVSVKNQTAPINNNAQNETPVIAKDRTTQELEAWNLVKNSTDARDYRDFLGEFPNGANAENAKIKLEQAVWESVKGSGDAGKIKNYLDEFPSGANASSGRIIYGQLTRSKVQPAPTPTPNNSNSTTDSEKSNQFYQDAQVANPNEVNSNNNSEAIKAGTLISNSLGMKFAYSPAGSFQMGDSQDGPIHTVTISQGFYLGRTEVTQAQWVAVMGTNPSKFKGDNLPVEKVSWVDVQEFIGKLNEKGEGTYRLPTEAEWEYAARAVYTGDMMSNAWVAENAGNKTHEVGTKLPNAWGLYDMYGNVDEWVQDWYKKYSGGSETDPQGPLSGSYRVHRGGSWMVSAEYCNSTIREINSPPARQNFLGFRVLRTK